jgi:threonine/homoserine efflux transporter RhtA
MYTLKRLSGVAMVVLAVFLALYPYTVGVYYPHTVAAVLEFMGPVAFALWSAFGPATFMAAGLQMLGLRGKKPDEPSSVQSV